MVRLPEDLELPKGKADAAVTLNVAGGEGVPLRVVDASPHSDPLALAMRHEAQSVFAAVLAEGLVPWHDR